MCAQENTELIFPTVYSQAAESYGNSGKVRLHRRHVHFRERSSGKGQNVLETWVEREVWAATWARRAWGRGNTWVKGRLGRWWMGKVQRGGKGWDEEGARRMVEKVGGIQRRVAADFQDCSQPNRQSEKKHHQNRPLFLITQTPAAGTWGNTVGLG